MKITKLLLALLIVGATTLSCKETKKGVEKDMDDAIEAVDEAADDAADAIEDAAESLEDAATEAGEAVSDAVEDAGEAIESTANKAAADIKAAGFNVSYPKDSKLANNTLEGLNEIVKSNPDLTSYFSKAYGYAFFPKITKAGLGIGGAGGEGLVFEKGKVIGKATLMQATFGLQAGGEQYSEVIFFETKDALERFKNGKFKFAGGASAVLLEKGASVDVAYQDGVAVVTDTKGGIMADASLGTQKFKYKDGI